MARFTGEQIAQAKEASLTALAAQYGYHPVRVGNHLFTLKTIKKENWCDIEKLMPAAVLPARGYSRLHGENYFGTTGRVGKKRTEHEPGRTAAAWTDGYRRLSGYSARLKIESWWRRVQKVSVRVRPPSFIY